jgi:hypothetical protein
MGQGFPSKSSAGIRALIERPEPVLLKRHLVREVQSAQEYVPVTPPRNVDLLPKKLERVNLHAIVNHDLRGAPVVALFVVTSL